MYYSPFLIKLRLLTLLFYNFYFSKDFYTACNVNGFRRGGEFVSQPLKYEFVGYSDTFF